MDRTDQICLIEVKGICQGFENATVCCHAPQKKNWRFEVPSPEDVSLEISRYGVHEPFQYLLRGGTFLLSVDHIRFRKHRAPSRYPGRIFHILDPVAYLFHIHFHANRLLVYKRSRTGGAFTIRSVFIDGDLSIPIPFQAHEFRCLGPDLKNCICIRVEIRNCLCNRPEFVFVISPKSLCNGFAESSRCTENELIVPFPQEIEVNAQTFFHNLQRFTKKFNEVKEIEPTAGNVNVTVVKRNRPVKPVVR